MASPVIISANVSNVKCDGEVIPGLQAIEFQIVRNRQNIHNIGIDERVGIDYGPMYVQGVLRIRSTYPKFDTMLVSGIADIMGKSFQLVVEMKYGATSIRTLSFDECCLEGKDFRIDANGIGITDYRFTGTRVREQ